MKVVILVFIRLDLKQDLILSLNLSKEIDNLMI